MSSFGSASSRALAAGCFVALGCTMPAAADLTFNVDNSGVLLAGNPAPGAVFLITPLSDGIGFDGQAGPYGRAAWNAATGGNDALGLTFTSQGTFSGSVPAGSLFQMNWLFGLNFSAGEIHYTVTSTMRARQVSDNALVQRVRAISGIATASGFIGSSNDLIPAVPADCVGDNWNLFLEVFWTAGGGPAIPDDASLNVLIPSTARINLVLPTGNVPAPAAAGLLAMAGIASARRRR